MLGVKLNGFRGYGSGFAWPNSPNGTGVIKDVFGPRPFSYHLSTVGYNYDFHRGVDLNLSLGDLVYSPVDGAICRQHYGNFGWEDDYQLTQFTLNNPSNSLSVSRVSNSLTLTASRVGSISFPTNVAKYQAIKERINPRGDDWTMEIQLSSTINLVGSVGIGIFSSDNAEYVALEYDGSTFTVRGVGTTIFTANGVTSSASNRTWFRIEYTLSNDTFTWRHSTDGDNWTNITTETGITFSSSLATYIPTLYWRSVDANVTPYTINVSKLNWYDLTQTISRFGNWIEIQGVGKKIVMQHFQSFRVALGDFVTVGQPLGYAGKTGFDALSGRVLAVHSHIEYASNNNYTYANDDSINILDAAILPRVNVNNNVSVVRTRENDPDGIDSHRLNITITRQDQDFDLNQVTLTGNTNSRTVNFNTRSGLNSNNDIPKTNGVYIVPSAFDNISASYNVSFYFNVATVGSTFVSYVILDTQGNTLANG